MKNLTILSLLFIMVSCSPNINYLGDTFKPTDQIDIYYDEGDIKREFRVMGQLSGDNVNTTVRNLEDVQNSMIEEAKLRGAHGIWFLYSESFDQDHIIKSKLIRYRN